MTHWFPQTKQIVKSCALCCDSEKNSSLSSYIIVHLTTSFFGPATMTITCVKWALRPASSAQALAGPDTCPRSAVPATLDRMWLINRPVLITRTPLTVVAVTWIPRWGDSKLRGKCNGFCNIATHCDSELHQRPDVITCAQDADAVFYGDYSENRVSAQIVMVFASIAPVLSIKTIQRGNKDTQRVVCFTSTRIKHFRHETALFIIVCKSGVVKDAETFWLIRSL